MMLEIQFLAWTSNFRSLNIKKTMTYDVGNPVPCLTQAQQCGGIIHSFVKATLNRIKACHYEKKV